MSAARMTIAALSAAASAVSDLGRRTKDGWINVTTGLGMIAYDRSKGADFEAPETVIPQKLTNLYRGDDLCRKVVEFLPAESLRRGLCFSGPEADQLRAHCTRLNLVPLLQEALTWGRLYGGACLVLDTGDEALDTPVRYRRGMPVRSLRVLDRRDMTPEPYHNATDGYARRKSEAAFYRVQPLNETPFYLHRSRAIWFGGIRTDLRTKEEILQGWDDSALQPVLEALAAFNQADLAIDNMLSDASQAVFRMKGLLDLLAGNPEIAERRASFMNLSRSVAKAVMLDADANETFEKIATDFSSVPEIWDRKAQRVASASGLPMTVLFGISPAGLNATGESDLANVNNRILAWRVSEIQPSLDLLAWLLTATDTKISFPSLVEPTEKETQETRKLRLEGDKIEADTFASYITNEIVSPEEASKELAARGRIAAVVTAAPTTDPLALPVPTDTGSKLVLTPSDAASIVTVNEARASLGLSPLDGPDGTLTLSEFKAKNAAVIATGEAATQGTAPVAATPAPAMPVVP